MNIGFVLPKFGMKMAQIWPNIDFLYGPRPGPAQIKKVQARSRPKGQVLKTAQALGRPKRRSAQIGLGPQNFGPNPSLVY